ncbi:MAG: sigma-70 family RNA polymerase sigma factor [Ruminococcaceae bacterium]|nr:sigma-70 family RNA polymerase sigma factor [Oscillospiraceae bacterium]
MEDCELIRLLFERSERALNEIATQYGGLCKSILKRYLSNPQDVEECENDVWMGLWTQIPPNRPQNLTAYIGRLARNTAIDRLRYNTRQKRGTTYAETIDELNECVADTPIKEANTETLNRLLSDFLNTLDAETKILFLRRYVYFESVASLASRFDMSENRVSVKLYRARKKLRAQLKKEGFFYE